MTFALLIIVPGLASAASFPKPVLPPGPRVHGEAALSRLGNRLPEVAAYYGKTAQELRSIFRRDATLWLARDGNLDYVCALDPLTAPVMPQVEPLDGSFEVLESTPPNATFFLHSRPSATRVIFLDFDGHVTSGLSWNNNYADGADIVTPPYDTDSNPNGFSATELANIEHIWQRVAEDFSPYDVDVTTEDPGVDNLRKTSSNDARYGIRVCIGGSSLDWYHSAGGVASVGSFSSSADMPCFVFPAQLSKGNKKYVADAASHEIGHTLGLHHDGVTGGASYYSGHGDWAPIMGLGYYVTIAQWSKGEYPSANNTEDDLAVMQTYVGYRSDDHGNQRNLATPLSPDGENVTAAGVIETSTDLDLFSFSAQGGRVTFLVNSPAPGPNLDVKLTLFDANNRPINTSDPATLEAALEANVEAGIYYLAVEGVGAGDLTTGYSDYGSLGQYQVIGVLPAIPPSRPSPPAGLKLTGGR